MLMNTVQFLELLRNLELCTSYMLMAQVYIVIAAGLFHITVKVMQD